MDSSRASACTIYLGGEGGGRREERGREEGRVREEGGKRVEEGRRRREEGGRRDGERVEVHMYMLYVPR